MNFKIETKMKKGVFKFLGMMAFASALVFTSCSGDDDNAGEGPSSTFVVVPNDFKGTISDGEVVLNASVEYKLTGALVIGDGASLRIPAGTRIVAQDVSIDTYIAAAQGGKIFVEGTSSNPVIFTSSVQEPGKWGGLVICGKAHTNRGATAQSEVAGLTYGGTVENDNSGSIKYLRIEYAGKIISGEKEFNGLSMFGVGSGTTIENVQAYHGSDDGFEWFGGSVNTKNLVSVGNQDDQFDWTEGWNGTNENWYAKEGFGVANRGLEADNLEANFDATPISEPTVNNFTLIGLGDQGAEPQAMKLRHGTKAHFNNVVIANWKTGIDIQHDQSLSFIPSGLRITGVKFIDVATIAKGTNTAGGAVDVTAAYTINESATGAGNGVSLPTWAQGWTNMSGL